jgi:thymidylate kinase
VPRSRGKSIVFEGLGRVGKTTQAKFLADDINALRPE